MSSAIFPFSLAERRTLINRQARYASELNSDTAERHIQQQLKMQGEGMRRKGVNDDLIALELRCMDCAIRDLLTRAVSGGAR